MCSKKNDYIYFKELTSDLINIRELKLEDDTDIFDLLGNHNVTKYLGVCVLEDIIQARLFIEKARIQYSCNDIFYLGIVNNINNKVVGYIGLSIYDLTKTTAQIVYALNEDYWGEGLMVRAVRMFNDYLFNIQKKEIIIATHIDKNQNSGKVMIKSGMYRDENYDRVMVIKGKSEKLIGYSIKRSKL